MKKVFPAGTFIQHVLELVVNATQRHVGAEEERKYDVPIREREAALASFEKVMSMEYRGKMEVALKQKRERESRKPTPSPSPSLSPSLSPSPSPVLSPKPRPKRGRGEDDDEGVDVVVEDIL